VVKGSNLFVLKREGAHVGSGAGYGQGGSGEAGGGAGEPVPAASNEIPTTTDGWNVRDQLFIRSGDPLFAGVFSDPQRWPEWPIRGDVSLLGTLTTFAGEKGDEGRHVFCLRISAREAEGLVNSGNASLANLTSTGKTERESDISIETHPRPLSDPHYLLQSFETYGYEPQTLQFASLLGYAFSLNIFFATHRFCSRCGAPLSIRRPSNTGLICDTSRPDIWARETGKDSTAILPGPVPPSSQASTVGAEAGKTDNTHIHCKKTFFPITFPCAIGAILCQDRILFSHRVGKLYTHVSGYVDPSEPAEATFIREVREEVGLRLRRDQVRMLPYTQPWPSGSTLMICFVARCDPNADGSLPIVPTADSEGEDAFWCSREEYFRAVSNYPEHPWTPPNKRSVARYMYDHWYSGDLESVFDGGR